MLKNLKLFLLLFFSFTIKAQLSPILCYNQGVEFYNKQEFKKADSLFTVSIALEPNKDTYFSRGLCRGKMSDKKGYCIDMAYASYLGEEKALKLFSKGCGKIDTIYIKVENKVTPTVIYSRELRYKFGDSDYVRVKDKYYTQVPQPNIIKKTVDTTKGPEVFTTIEEMAEFPGGIVAMQNFINKNLIVPSKKPLGKVFLQFIVNEDGSLHAITVMKGIPGCPECNEEATRVVAIMPNWKPAKMAGSAVKCYFNLPVSFKAK